MSLFGSLAAIGTAISSGIGMAAGTAATAAGISGTAGTAATLGATAGGLTATGAAAGTGMAGAIGSAAGAIGTGAMTGAAGGAALSAATGGDPAQGAGLGALTGGALGGVGAALAPAGQAATTAGEAILNPTAQAAAPGVQTVGDIATETAMNQVGNAVTPGAANIASTAPIATEGGSAFGGIGSLVNNDFVKSAGMDVAKEGIGTGVQNMQQGAQQASSNRAAQAAFGASQQKQADEENALNKKMADLYSGGISGGKGIGFEKGGEVGLQEGQFIIPADVVSALGNGSTKAGANFLDEFFKV